MTLLVEHWDDRVDWNKQVGSITANEVLKGSPETALAVVVAHAPTLPSRNEMQALWKLRRGQSADPVLVFVEYEHAGAALVALLGLTADAPVVPGVERVLAERLVARALENDSPSGLATDLRKKIATMTSGLGGGLRNEGLFASHVLVEQLHHPEWKRTCSASQPMINLRGENLLQILGYTINVVADGIVLRQTSENEASRAAAVLLTANESFDNPLGRFAGTTAVTHGLALARREGVDWLIVLGGSVLRLFPADPDVGVGRKGETQTFVELDLDLLADDKAGYLTLLFAPEALATGGSVTRLLGDSAKYATGLSGRLRDRIYQDVIPILAVAVAEANGATRLPEDQQKPALDEAYHQAMIVLFRLLFVAYAEDRGLLPLDTNEAYKANALKTLAHRILNDPDQGFSETSSSLWADLVQVWDVIDVGDLEGMGVPAYNGGLFTRDASKNPSGSHTYDLRLTNDVVGPVLRGLLIDSTADDVLGPVDFRSLDVREFGTIYEGLLESGLGIANIDLTLDKNDNYAPAEKGESIIVAAGDIYFHSRSGSRKATGSYFTKPFAVQHLLDTALEPALDEHLSRVATLVAEGRHQTASKALFDFRVADLSMGSAHFLVAAIDRIEARFSAFLAQTPLPEVAAELQHLRNAASEQLGLPAEESGIDDGVLLRRQIARRCIYGVDINEIAVELARLAVWIHTFVPGLPLSFLNHGLTWGNSLTGVGTVQEIVESIAEAERREHPKSAPPPGATHSLTGAIDDFMIRAAESLADLAALSDASIADVHAGAVHQSRIEDALQPLTDLCDLVTAERATRHLKKDDPHRILIGASPNLFIASEAESLVDAVTAHPQLGQARTVASTVQAAHLPLRFPEVFQRTRPGFDVVLGNPPWEKLKVEEDGWWAVRFPGLLSMSQQDKNAAIATYRDERPDLVAEFDADLKAAKQASQVLTAGPYPGIGATDVDLFSAFCWRFWHTSRDHGRVGVVLPRTALAGAATTMWRQELLRHGAINDLTMLTNSARWAFDMEPRYTIALLTFEHGAADHVVRLRGPFASHADYTDGMAAGDAVVAVADAATVLSWSDTAALPLVPSTELDVFAALRKHPSLAADIGTWRFRPHRELDGTKEKRLYDFNLEHPDPASSLPVWTGGTFNLWGPGSGQPYAYANPDELIPFLQDKRLNQVKLKTSAFHAMPAGWAEGPDTLPMLQPRIAFRDVCRATDSRTMICSLVPGGVALVGKAPYLMRLAGSSASEAYVLGILSSRTFDWFTRRFVEMKMSHGLVNDFPVPRVDESTGHTLGLDGTVTGQVNVSGIRDRVIEVSGRLASVDARFSEWAAEVGVPVGSVGSESEKQDLIDELDALVAILYGLSVDQVGKVFATFHRGWDYKPRLASVVAHYEMWMSTLDKGEKA